VLNSNASYSSYVNDTTAKSLGGKVKGKGKDQPRTRHEGPEGE